MASDRVHGVCSDVAGLLVGNADPMAIIHLLTHCSVNPLQAKTTWVAGATIRWACYQSILQRETPP
jgi:hypothetical protein